MTPHRELAYRLDPALWVEEVFGVAPTKWQEAFLRSPRGAFIMALTARQVGKTTVAGWAIAHAMTFYPGSLSVIACPAQRQSAEVWGARYKGPATLPVTPPQRPGSAAATLSAR